MRLNGQQGGGASSRDHCFLFRIRALALGAAAVCWGLLSLWVLAVKQQSDGGNRQNASPLTPSSGL